PTRRHARAGGQRPAGAHQAGNHKDLTHLIVPGDLQTDLFIIAFVGVIIGLYVLANFGERSATPRILTLIAGGVLAGLSSLIGVLGSLLHLLAYSAGGETAATFRLDEQTLLPFAAAGILGLVYLVPAVQRAVARLLPIRPGRSEEHTSELQSRGHLVCRLLLEKKKKTNTSTSLHPHQPTP